jgi:DNA mismatch repair protein MutS2
MWNTMDIKSLNTLELPKILERLASHCAFSASKELALALTPSPDHDEVVTRLRRTSEARHLISSKANARVGGARDVRGAAFNATKGAVLDPSTLLDIRQTLISGRTLQRIIVRAQEQYPLLADLARQIEPGDALIDAIAQAIDEDGKVKDEASPALRRIRRELDAAHSRLLERLNRIVANPDNAKFLQEAIVTQRQGRYVIPIKVESRGRIPGVVHDQSSSGATIFVEPLATLELNNAWRELELEEQREIERILRELSGMVADSADDIEATVGALAALDLEFGKAEYSFALRANEPVITDVLERETESQPYVHLMRARHPLLNAETVVPTDIFIGPDYHLLVITGPNTGGKTVTLKNVGLMAAMAQCGLHIPAGDGSRLPVFDNIFADIGDEQSIEQSLSTFSSHLRNITRILDGATNHSLVVLDEVGAGTDPVEGSALARALPEHFLENDITAVVATHYSDLKAYAHNTPHVKNASVEFDLETLRPTYKLMIGLPGRSNALNIAERLGLPADILEKARSFVSGDDQSVDAMLADIKQAQESARLDRRFAEQDRKEQEQLRNELRTRLAAIEDDRRTVINTTREEAKADVEIVREQLRQVTRQLERLSATGTGKKAEVQDLRELLQGVEDTLKPIAPPRPARTSDTVVNRPLQVGDIVYVPSLDRNGEILEMSGSAAEVQAGNFRLRVALRDLELRTPVPEKANDWAGGKTRRQRADISLPMVESPGMEIDVRGEMAEEALQRVERYLDNAYRSGLPFVRIVHGKGTGVLRRTIREYLRRNPTVKEARDGELNEGGDGVTVVRFKDN